MKAHNVKKYTVFFCLIFFLFVALYLSMNDKGLQLSTLYAKEAKNEESKQADKKTAESSTSTQAPNDNTDMTQLLARLINGEARGEPYEGQVAVGAVILNRVKSPKFPNTISGVIYQKGQFSCVTDGQFDQPMEENSTVYKAAKEAMNGSDPTNGATYFYNPKKTSNKYLYSLPVVLTIGDHKFAKEAEEK